MTHVLSPAERAQTIADKLETAAQHLRSARNLMRDAHLLSKADYTFNDVRPGALLGGVDVLAGATLRESNTWHDYADARKKKS
jgi:hypothetical protein